MYTHTSHYFSQNDEIFQTKNGGKGPIYIKKHPVYIVHVKPWLIKPTWISRLWPWTSSVHGGMVVGMFEICKRTLYSYTTS
jgi:hypothetical protein